MNQNTPDKAGGGEVRNGWVLCPSKRFPGRYYYFNVLNGECAWSLNDIDKAKLKKDGHIKRADSFHSYPEPSSPPIDFISPNTSGPTLNVNPTNHSQNVYMPSAPTVTGTPQNYVHNNYSTPQQMMNSSTPAAQVMNCQPMYLQPNLHIILATPYPMQNVQNGYYTANAMKRLITVDQNTQTPDALNNQNDLVCVETTETPLSEPINEEIVENANLFNDTREVMFDKNQEDYIPFQKHKVVIKNPTASVNQNDLRQNKTRRVSGTNNKVQCKEIQTEPVKILDANAKPCECSIPKPNRKRIISEHSLLDSTTKRRKYPELHQLNESELELKKLYFVDTVGNKVQSESTKNNAKAYQRVTEIENREAERVTEKANENVSNLSRSDMREKILDIRRKKSVDLGEGRRLERLTGASTINVEGHKDIKGASKAKKKVTFDFSHLESVQSILSDTTDRGTSADVPAPEPRPLEPADEGQLVTPRPGELPHRRAGDIWYIVVDLEMLTRDFDFVETLVTHDPACRLYLPLSLRSKLHALTRSFISARHQVTAARKLVRRLASAEEWVVAQNESDLCEEVDIIGCCVTLKNNGQRVVLLTNNALLLSEAEARQIHCYNKEQASLVLTEKQNITFDPKQFKIAIVNDSCEETDEKENQNRKQKPNAAVSKKNENQDSEKRTLPKTNEQQINRALFKQFKMAAEKTKEAFMIAQNYVQLAEDDEVSMEPLGVNEVGDVTSGIDSEVGRETFGAANGENSSSDRTSSYTFDIERELVEFSVLRPTTETRFNERRDEWICCYVQTMEEALTQVIQSLSPSRQVHAPGSLREASELIRRGYREHNIIRRVAEKLTSLLYKSSNNKGVLKSNIKCGDYMRIIGCSILLIEYLNEHHPANPDLTSARSGLSDLLRRVEDPTTDSDARLFDVKLTRGAGGECDDEGSPVRGSIKAPADVLPYLRRHFPAWRDHAHVSATTAAPAPASPQMYTNWNADVTIVRTRGRNLDRLKIDKTNNMSIDKTTKPMNQNASDNDIYYEAGTTFDSNANVTKTVNTAESSVNAVNSIVDTVESNNNQRIVRKFCRIEELEKKHNNVFFSQGLESASRINLPPSDDFTNDEFLYNDSWKGLSENQTAVAQNDTEFPTSTGDYRSREGIDNGPQAPSHRAPSSADVMCVTEDCASDRGGGLRAECQIAVTIAKQFLSEVKRLFLNIYDFVCAALGRVFEPPGMVQRACALRARLRGLQGILCRIVQRESGDRKLCLRMLLVESGDSGDDNRMRQYRQVALKCSEQAELLLRSLELVRALSSVGEHKPEISPHTTFHSLVET